MLKDDWEYRLKDIVTHLITECYYYYVNQTAAHYMFKQLPHKYISLPEFPTSQITVH